MEFTASERALLFLAVLIGLAIGWLSAPWILIPR